MRVSRRFLFAPSPRQVALLEVLVELCRRGRHRRLAHGSPSAEENLSKQRKKEKKRRNSVEFGPFLEVLSYYATPLSINAALFRLLRIGKLARAVRAWVLGLGKRDLA